MVTKKKTTKKQFTVLGKKMTQGQYNDLVDRNLKTMTKQQFEKWMVDQLDEANPNFIKKAQKELDKSFKRVR